MIASHQSDTELVCRYARRIEGDLRDHFGAQGHGLGQMARSLEGNLPNTLLWAVRRVARTRNQVIHGSGSMSERERESYLRSCVDVINDLYMLKPLLLGSARIAVELTNTTVDPKVVLPEAGAAGADALASDVPPLNTNLSASTGVERARRDRP